MRLLEVNYKAVLRALAQHQECCGEASSYSAIALFRVYFPVREEVNGDACCDVDSLKCPPARG
jgi:hypothetical protein